MQSATPITVKKKTVKYSRKVNHKDQIRKTPKRKSVSERLQKHHHFLPQLRAIRPFTYPVYANLESFHPPNVLMDSIQVTRQLILLINYRLVRLIPQNNEPVVATLNYLPNLLKGQELFLVTLDQSLDLPEARRMESFFD